MVNACFVASHQSSSPLAHPDTRLGFAHKRGHSTALRLREKLSMLKALKARALSMELAHLWLNFLLIEMGWCWSLPDACSEQGRGDVLQNRIRAKLQGGHKREE